MAKDTIYVTGHKNPDSDAIISSMAYAYLKQQLGYDAIAVRAGEINSETEFILSMFNEFAPPLASDIKTRVRDIDFDDVVLVDKDKMFKEILDIMREEHKKSVIVADEKRQLVGMATLADITSLIVYDLDKKNVLLQQTPLGNIASVIKGEIIVDCGNSSNGQIYVVSGQHFSCEDRLCIVSDNVARQRQAIEQGARVLIIAGDFYDESIAQLCRQKGCSLLLSNRSIYRISRDIDLAIPIKLAMTPASEITTFNFDDYVDEVKIKINKSRFRAYPVIDRHGHVIGLLSRFHVLKHTNRNLILVDHNEFNQSLDGADQANILEIVDHHRIGGIKTSSPVFFRNEMTGSCATIITEIFEEKGVEIPDDLAGLLCCAILSDTVNFRSVTCTQKDIDQCRKMARKANLNIEELGPAILRAGASLKNKTMESILHHDLKRFKIGKKNIAIGQNNIESFEAIVGIRDKMNRLLEDFSRNNNLNIVIMVFSLIDGTGSYLLFKGEDEVIVEYAFEDIAVNVDGYMFLPKVMSRKLQIVPRITAAAEDR